MGLFSRKIKPDKATVFKMVNEMGNGFYKWNGNLYQSDIVRACIRPMAKNIGKLVSKHIRNSKDGVMVNPEPYMRFLLEEPNQYMTGQMLQEKMAIQLALNNNAFALIIKDDFDIPKEIYPIPASGVEALYSSDEKLFLKFHLNNGKSMTLAYTDIIHIRQDFNDNDLFGTSPADTLKPLMEIVTATDQGIVKAIKNSAIVKWLLKFKNILNPEDVDQQIKGFVKNYLSIDSDVAGAAATDPRYDAEQVKPHSYVPNASQMDRTITRIYNFFNTNEKIIQSKSSEDEFTAYFEAVIEPLARQLSEEFSRKLFTRKARGFGNKIIFEASNLSYASMQTKLGLVQFVDRGMMTPNEVREIFNMGPIEHGDEVIRRLDTAAVEGGDK